MFVLQKLHLDHGRNKISFLCYHHFYCSLEYLFSVSITFIVVMCPCSQSRLSFIDPVISCCWTVVLLSHGLVWQKVGQISEGIRFWRLFQELHSFYQSQEELLGLIWMELYLFFAGWTFHKCYNLSFFGYFKVAKFQDVFVMGLF